MRQFLAFAFVSLFTTIFVAAAPYTDYSSIDQDDNFAVADDHNAPVSWLDAANSYSGSGDPASNETPNPDSKPSQNDESVSEFFNGNSLAQTLEGPTSPLKGDCASGYYPKYKCSKFGSLAVTYQASCVQAQCCTSTTEFVNGIISQVERCNPFDCSTLSPSDPALYCTTCYFNGEKPITSGCPQ